MSSQWVHLSPVILTDAMYFANIGMPLYTGTAAQRNVAYLAAERAVIRHLKTPLIPTTITGTYLWPSLMGTDGYGDGRRTLVLEHARIQTIDRVSVLYGANRNNSCELQSTEGCVRVRDDTYGYVDVYVLGAMCSNACGHVTDPYQVEITWTAGLLTGTSSVDTNLHMALSMIAEEFLNELIDPGANPGGPGAPGVTRWGSLGYTETPNPESLKMTTAGASARMNTAMRLIRDLKKNRALKFG